MIFELLDYLFNIHEWMSPNHCTPSNFVRYEAVISGTYVCFVYFVFSSIILFGLKKFLDDLLGFNFAFNLGVVFLLCGSTHLFHSLAYIHEYWKIGMIFSYPLLVVFHSLLLRSALKIRFNLKRLKTGDDYDTIINENTKLKIKVANYEKSISKAILKNNIGIIKDTLK